MGRKYGEMTMDDEILDEALEEDILDVEWLGETAGSDEDAKAEPGRDGQTGQEQEAGQKSRFLVIREGSRTYLVKACRAEREDEETMIADNRPESLLSVSVRYRNGQPCHYYDITGKQSLSHCYEIKNIGWEELCTMLISVGSCLDRTEEYLLSEDRLLFEPEYIYTGIDSRPLWFVYDPLLEGTFAQHIRELARFLMERVDYRDERAVTLSCQFCKYTDAENFNMAVFFEENASFFEPDIRSEEASCEDESSIRSAEDGEEKTDSLPKPDRARGIRRYFAVAGLFTAALIGCAAWTSPKNAPVLIGSGICAGIAAIFVHGYNRWAGRVLLRKEREVYQIYSQEQEQNPR